MEPNWTMGYMAVVAMYVAAVLTAVVLPNRLKSGPLDAGRMGHIDGLRGFLALAVMAHHFSFWIMAVNTGEMTVANNILFANLGPAAVSIFFMITGLLFYGKLVRSAGKIERWQLYKGRLCRLYPAYLVGLCTVLFLSLLTTSKTPAITDPRSIISVINSLLFTVPFGYLDLFGVNLRLEYGVIWTLRYEWCFYLFIPILGFFIRVLKTNSKRISCLIMLLVACFMLGRVAVFGIESKLCSGFVWGMIAYELVSIDFTRRVFMRRGLGILALLCTLSALSMFSIPFAFAQSFLLFLSFCVVAVGNRELNFLSWRPCIVLGDASYSIYLLHVPLINLFLFFIQPYLANNHLLNGPMQWALLPVVAIAVSVVAGVNYYVVEYPAIIAGRPKRSFDRLSKEIQRAAP